jgi:hypothetical protein
MCIAEQTMTLTLNLLPELEQYLLQEADQQHISIAPLAPKAIEVMTIQLLTQSALSR